MTDYVTPQTATRLKQAGFKQPVPAPGQVWIGQKYGTDIAQYGVIIGDKIVFESGEFNNLGVVERGRYLYAPTAPDILRELGGNYTLSFLGKVSTCTNTSLPAPGLLKMENIYYHENPAEACALALEAKQKQP